MIQRYQMVARHSGDGGLYVRPLGDADGEWMRHSDHLAALEAARREAREEAFADATKALTAEARRMNAHRDKRASAGASESDLAYMDGVAAAFGAVAAHIGDSEFEEAVTELRARTVLDRILVEDAPILRELAKGPEPEAIERARRDYQFRLEPGPGRCDSCASLARVASYCVRLDISVAEPATSSCPAFCVNGPEPEGGEVEA